ncbi:MAG: hypothetical protein Q4A37_00625 [Candidatus Saccharibacteria bacterium]|nr:hypothetical protein [Candidatus Saccharibacteria bacterium]
MSARRVKNSKNQKPSPQIGAEIAIIFGGLWLVGLGVLVATKGFVALLMAAAMSGMTVVGIPLSMGVLTYAIVSIAVGIKVLGEVRRVDRYKQRLMAIYGALIPFILGYATFILSRALGSVERLGGTQLLEASGAMELTYLLGSLSLFPSIATSCVSLVWLWHLLIKKDKLVWILKTPKDASEAGRRQLSRLSSYREYGIYIMALPVVCLILTSAMHFLAAFDGASSLVVLAVTIESLLFAHPTWLIFTIIGMGLVYASEYKG